MSRRRRVTAHLAALGALLLVGAAPARAQRIDGRLVSARDSTPVAGALVQLFDASGTRVAQTSSGTEGMFRLAAPAGGRYAVAVLRIGQHPWRSAPTVLDAGLPQHLTLAVPDAPIELAAISVEARSACRASPDDRTVVGDLLAEAQKALILTRMEMERRRGSGFDVVLWRRTLTSGFVTLDSTSEPALDVAWPIQSAPPESLAVHGFVRPGQPSKDHPFGLTTYYGPDAAVLFSSWFLDTHCFRVSQGTGEDRDAVVVAYAPARGRRGADIAGRLVIERATLALRRIEWRFVGLEEWVTTDGAGGSLTLQRLPSGVIIPVRWAMRAPVAEVDRARRPVRIAGWVETGGEFLQNP